MHNNYVSAYLRKVCRPRRSVHWLTVHQKVSACKMKWRNFFFLVSSFCFSSLAVTNSLIICILVSFLSANEHDRPHFLEAKINWYIATNYYDFSSKKSYCHGKADTCSAKMVMIRASKGNNWSSDEYIHFAGNMRLFGRPRRRWEDNIKTDL